ncbi:hypothetical protein HDU93_006983 [Gonapodya sp. JEL0774]|nr:hypothetical protein HDU93_006983 [Gonapodya sp. JEL0774]
MPPRDPLIYRFYEIVLVYGTTLKAVIHEKFGDGIMSAIDYKMTVEKEKFNGSDYVKVNYFCFARYFPSALTVRVTMLVSQPLSLACPPHSIQVTLLGKFLPYRKW